MTLQRFLPVFLLFIAAFNVKAQLVLQPCSSPDQPGEFSCFQACVNCDFQGGITDNNAFGGSGGPVICNQITLENARWYGFIAGSSSITMQITPVCQMGNGLQMAFFESCSTDALVCNPGALGGGNTPLTLTYSDFEPGRTYYLMVDGFTGDVCDYTVEVLSGSTVPPAPAPTPIPVGLTQVCPGATAVYYVPEVSGAGYYQWTAPPGAFIHGGNGNIATLPVPDGASVTITFGLAGGQVCVKAFNTCIDGTQACLPVTVQPIPPTILPPLVIASNDLPFAWQIPPFSIISTLGTFTLTSVAFQSWLGCDSIVRQTIQVVPGLTPDAGGFVFHDNNSDGLYNAGDGPAAQVLVSASGGMATLTNSLGLYLFFNLQPGDTLRPEPGFAVSSIIPPFRLYQPGQPVSYDFALATLPAGPTASGYVHYDLNFNGMVDAGEPPAAQTVVGATNGTAATTLPNGIYQLTNLQAGDTIRVVAPPAVTAVLPPFHIYQAGQISGYDFLLQQPPQAADLSIDLTNTFVFRQGFITPLVLTVRNKTTTPVANVQVKLVLPPALDFVSASLAPVQVQGDTVCWSLGMLGPLEVRFISVKVFTVLGTANNTPLHLEAWVEPQSDAEPADNIDILETATVGSYDPNDKQVNPTHVTPGLLEAGTGFEYTIRFQNTGNYPADFVRIIDTLSPLVEASSVRFIASSHPCEWRLRGAGIIDVYFPNIQLPDSASNGPESHGFVKFAVQPKTSLELGTAVENFCDIYFDFNTPVRTNTAETQVVYFLPADGLPPDGEGMSVRPNPASQLLRASWRNALAQDGLLRLFGIDGLPAAEVAVPAGAHRAQVDVSLLPPGLYIAVLEGNGGVLVERVVVIGAEGNRPD